MDNTQAGSRLDAFWRVREAIRESGLFDSGFYRRQSLEAALWPSALVHYLMRGWRQGLDPSALFDTSFYLERYRDVRGGDVNPLMHYVLHGKEEGRLATQSGAIAREHLHPELSDLPIFAVPGEAGSRISLVIDDHTPRLLGVGYTPLLALAQHVAAEQGRSLRVIIRSKQISSDDVSDAIRVGMPEARPQLEITRRDPGHTDDVETLEGEWWWAGSIGAYDSLRRLVDSEHLLWVISADEMARTPDPELRLRAQRALRDPEVHTLLLGSVLTEGPAPEGPSARVEQLPALFEVQKSSAGAPIRVGCVFDQTSSECLNARVLQLIDDALAHGVLEPGRVEPVVVGTPVEPLTMMGSVVVDQRGASHASQWSEAIRDLDVLVSLRAGTEGAWLVESARAVGVATLDVTPTTSGADIHDSHALVEALKTVLDQAGTPGSKKNTGVTWAEVQGQLAGVPGARP